MLQLWVYLFLHIILWIMHYARVIILLFKINFDWESYTLEKVEIESYTIFWTLISS